MCRILMMSACTSVKILVCLVAVVGWRGEGAGVEAGGPGCRNLQVWQTTGFPILIVSNYALFPVLITSRSRDS